MHLTTRTSIPKSNNNFRRNGAKGKQTVSRVPRSLLPELKSLSVAISMALNTSASEALLNGIVQGTTGITRVGRRIHMVAMDVFVYAAAGTGDSSNRFAIVKDRMPNTVAATYGDVFTGPGAVVDLPTCPRNVPNLVRFDVLADKFFSVSMSTEANSRRSWSIHIPLNLTVQFNNSNAGTIADIITNAIYIIGAGTQAAGADAAVLVGSSQILFRDD